MAKADSATSTYYYPIQYPYSVDRDIDPRTEAPPSGYFARLINYIPKGQVVTTRKGITEWS